MEYPSRCVQLTKSFSNNHKCNEFPHQSKQRYYQANDDYRPKNECYCVAEYNKPEEDPVGSVVSATMPLITPIEVNQCGNSLLVTASIPVEAIITLPRPALEIKEIHQQLFITQCRLLNAPLAIRHAFPKDNHKLFLGGFVRKDIQYVEALGHTSKCVDGIIRDFVVNIPVSGVVDLGCGIDAPHLEFDENQVYQYARKGRFEKPGFPDKERLLSSDYTEYNSVSNILLNQLPEAELVYSQITEMNEQLDRKSLCGAPLTEATFKTIQDKMVIIVQLCLTFPKFCTL